MLASGRGTIVRINIRIPYPDMYMVINYIHIRPEEDGGCYINVGLWTAVVHHNVPLRTCCQQLPFSVILGNSYHS